ncbi:UDP-N-acetylmuramoyl-L-alanyl-D-glutamate--2,6-diaminopimelate ligase [Kordiimonas gwangyangensis]|uniref:UDP-N-acetylmuramoyl-L-alanyl-D-glutamate--2, 6-diaminopimelate ligase n=1 Tax=Kordiimonas gwangyangensis TaxID=288022 RepID=UPI0003669F73|nr:UDP-N-acetylmuramoyl-L-alanyl-D-glutamate--2,6-diaminopimelate ligase [Kordiimonas gwangyangensis]
MALTLAQLLGGATVAGDVEISGMTVDSRAVKAGDLFVALPGTKVDGRLFIKAAVDAGASAVLTTDGFNAADVGVPVIEDVNPRRRYAQLAARFCGRQPEVQVAVTGTNGKTSVADFARQIWEVIGSPAASMGTLGVRSERYQEPGGLTTPDPMALHRALNMLAIKGVNHVAIEASSHGLDQFRLDGMRLRAAAFTNLTRDHLDYHKTEQGYFYAKARLFGDLIGPGGTAVINVDDPWGCILEDIAWARGLSLITVGRSKDAVLQLVAQEVTPAGQRIEVSYCGSAYAIELPLVGDFQAHNALVAAGLVLATGGDAEAVFAALEQLKGVPGRMELIGQTASGGSVFVDYAHTPDGLKTVLKAARSHNPNSLHVVFGCGGDRDAGKRPQMGEIAAALADHVYVTDDNPRSEKASAIRKDILVACPNATEVGDRRQAIETAMAALGQGDMLIVAGKGHEEGQTVGDKILPFSDIGTVREILTGASGQVSGANGG